MEVLGNGGDLRAAGRKGNRSDFTPGGLISELFGRIFWLFGWAVRLTSIPIQTAYTARCRLSCRALELSYNLHYVK
jgi:hypothetical protein